LGNLHNAALGGRDGKDESARRQEDTFYEKGEGFIGWKGMKKNKAGDGDSDFEWKS